MDTELINLERRLVTMYHSILNLIRKNQTFNIEQQLNEFTIIVEEIPAKYSDVIQKWKNYLVKLLTVLEQIKESNTLFDRFTDVGSVAGSVATTHLLKNIPEMMIKESTNEDEYRPNDDKSNSFLTYETKLNQYESEIYRLLNEKSCENLKLLQDKITEFIDLVHKIPKEYREQNIEWDTKLFQLLDKYTNAKSNDSPKKLVNDTLLEEQLSNMESIISIYLHTNELEFAERSIENMKDLIEKIPSEHFKMREKWNEKFQIMSDEHAYRLIAKSATKNYKPIEIEATDSLEKLKKRFNDYKEKIELVDFKRISIKTYKQLRKMKSEIESMFDLTPLPVEEVSINIHNFQQIVNDIPADCADAKAEWQIIVETFFNKLQAKSQQLNNLFDLKATEKLPDNDDVSVVQNIIPKSETSQVQTIDENSFSHVDQISLKLCLVEVKFANLLTKIPKPVSELKMSFKKMVQLMKLIPPECTDYVEDWEFRIKHCRRRLNEFINEQNKMKSNEEANNSSIMAEDNEIIKTTNNIMNVLNNYAMHIQSLFNLTSIPFAALEKMIDQFYTIMYPYNYHPYK